MSNKEAEQDTISEDGLEDMMEILSDAIDTSAKLYGLLADEGTSLVEGFAIMSLCSAMFLHDSSKKTGGDIKKIKIAFFEGVGQAYNLISKIDKEAVRASIQ
jgi:hypothetical protein